MIKEINEAQVLELMPFSDYQSLAMDVYQEILDSPTFKKPDKICYTIRCYELRPDLFLHLEASLIKKAPGVNDFGFTKFVLTNDMDFTFDRWNEAKELGLKP